MGKGAGPEKIVREIQRRTRRRFSAEEKIRIVLEGLRGEESIAELCRREGLAPNLYYRWSKEFLEAGKKRLLGDTKREATAPEVKGLREENSRLKLALADTVLENRLPKKKGGHSAPRATIREARGGGEARGDPPGGGLRPVGASNAAGAGREPLDLLRVVRALPRAWRRRSGAASARKAAALEPDPGSRAKTGSRCGLGRPREVAT